MCVCVSYMYVRQINTCLVAEETWRGCLARMRKKHAEQYTHLEPNPDKKMDA